MRMSFMNNPIKTTLKYRFLQFLVCNGLLFLCSCSSITYEPAARPHMVVSDEKAPFFSKGPAQAKGPDAMLANGDEVEVLRKEFGFSFVQLEGGQTGYVANDALVTAPPRAPEEVVPPEINSESNPSLFPDFRY